MTSLKIPTDILIDKIDDFTCPICSDLAYPPLKTQCGHLFCVECLTAWVKENKNCPCCRNEDPKPHNDLFITRLMNRLNTHCFNKEKGCNFSGELSSMLEHIETKCMFCEVTCKHEGCEIKIERRLLSSHLEICEYRIEPCSYCDQRIRAKDEKLHFEKCPKYPVKCLCGETIIRDNLQSHSDVCSEKLVQCPVKTCSRKLKKKDLSSHLMNNLVEHFTEMSLSVEKLENELESQKKKFTHFMNHQHNIKKKDGNITSELTIKCASIASPYLWRGDFPVYDDFYFEIILLSVPKIPRLGFLLPSVSIGYVTEDYQKDIMVGWESENGFGIGLHADDGRLFLNKNNGDSVGPTWLKEGVIAGCGMKDRVVYFKIYGEIIKKVPLPVDFTKNLYPAFAVMNGIFNVKVRFYL